LDFGLKKGKSMTQKFWSRVRNSYSGNPKSRSGPADQNPKWVGLVAVAITFALCDVVIEAQQPKKVARICYLGNAVSGPAAIYLKTFRERLREIGYIDGQNLTIESRYWEGKIERLHTLAAEVVSLKCDVILTTGTEAAEAAKNATKAIPVVMAFAADAVRLGIVADLAQPGGNITGLTDMDVDLYGKRLELLKETIPKLARVAVLWSPTNPNADDVLKAVGTVGRFLRVEVQSLEVKGSDDFEGVFKAATKKRAQALMLSGGGVLGAHVKRVVELAAENRLPAMYIVARFVEAGGLMAYGEDRTEMLRRAAEIVDMILKGTKPADIPVERPKKFEFVINLKTAKQIGLTIPPEVLARASRIIR
jgi:putative tryptophan/tyrosine transport system substrate-binding protein